MTATISIVTDERVLAEVAAAPYSLVFATISGAHLYGFPSADSDVDIRGVHVLPPQEVVGLDIGPETMQVSHVRGGLEIDLVTHDVRKFFRLLLRRNGYVLEQVCSPLIVHTTPEHAELKALVRGCVTRHHAYHYLGFAATEWRRFENAHYRRVKPLLYVYRVLLTGIHLMRTGEVESNLVRLNAEFRLPYLAELVARKVEGMERALLPHVDLAFHTAEYARLGEELQRARDQSSLPEKPSAHEALNELLLRLRLGPIGRACSRATDDQHRPAPGLCC